MTGPQRRAGRPWRRLRAQVLAGNPVCAICGRRRATTVDHIIPITKGGAEFDLANCRPACAKCNYRGGARITNARRADPRQRAVRSNRYSPYPAEAWLVRPGERCPYHEELCGTQGHLKIGWS